MRALGACSAEGASPEGSPAPAPDAGVDVASPQAPVAPSASPGKLGLNELTVLFPLPTTNAAALLGPAQVGGKGALLPRGLFDQLIAVDGLPELYERTRVVAARFIPCLPPPAAAPTLSSACTPTIRLSFAVFRPDREEPTAEDVAYHATYALTAQDFEAAIQEILVMGDKYGRPPYDAPLSVHPIMKAQGADGAVVQAFNALVLRHAGGDNLAEVTLMTEAGFGASGVLWSFAHFRIEGGAAVQVAIGSMADPESEMSQTVITNEGTTSIIGAPLPETPFDRSFQVATLSSASAEELGALVNAAHETLNPDKHGFSTQTCAACHLAEQALHLAKTERGVDVEASAMKYASAAFPLTNADSEAFAQPFRPRFFTMRLLGYMERRPVVSRRVVNETAQAAALVNQALASGAP